MGRQSCRTKRPVTSLAGAGRTDLQHASDCRSSTRRILRTEECKLDSYWVNVTGPAPDAYLKTARYGSSDALRNFRVNSGSDATLDLVGSTRGAHIQGVVMNADPVPISDVWVTLIPEDSSRKRLFQSTRSRANGKFEFRGVAPGNYALFSWDNIEEHEWDD